VSEMKYLIHEIIPNPISVSLQFASPVRWVDVEFFETLEFCR
jgi:hypothetical protein